MFAKRRNHLKQCFQGKQQNAVLISSPSNLYYYSGFTGGEAMLLLPFAKEEVFLITDSRYYEQVEKECPDVTLIRLEKNGYVETIREQLELLFADCEDTKIAIEAELKLSTYLKLCDSCGNCHFEMESDVINDGRMVKDEAELECIRKAEQIGDEAFSYILGMIKPGVSERDIALELEFFMKRKGADKLSFDTIVASGPNSSMPHAQVTDRKLQMGDFVTMDFGCIYKGYCSDMTRTVAVGEPTEEMKKVYQIVLDANIMALEGIREGVSCKEIDAIARDYIAKQGFGAYFGHGLGHSVGLEIHEEPRFSPKCDVVTKANMVITDEPGIYLPGRFGVRIEDLVRVTKDGHEVLSNSPKELIIL